MESGNVLYSELTPKEFKERIAEAPIAYIPLGTLEWHGEHLPLGSDGIQAQEFFIRLAPEAGGIVLPMLFLAPDINDPVRKPGFYGMDIVGFRNSGQKTTQLTGSAYWISTDLFKELCEAILKQLKRAGFRIIVGHGHGPSIRFFIDHADEWNKTFELEILTCRREDESDGLGLQADHAGANETSMVMAVRPELVHLENLAQDPDEKPVAVAGKDPRFHASKENGEEIIRTQITRMKKVIEKAFSKINNTDALERN